MGREIGPPRDKLKHNYFDGTSSGTGAVVAAAALRLSGSVYKMSLLYLLVVWVRHCNCKAES